MQIFQPERTSNDSHLAAHCSIYRCHTVLFLSSCFLAKSSGYFDFNEKKRAFLCDWSKESVLYIIFYHVFYHSKAFQLISNAFIANDTSYSISLNLTHTNSSTFSLKHNSVCLQTFFQTVGGSILRHKHTYTNTNHVPIWIICFISGLNLNLGGGGLWT